MKILFIGPSRIGDTILSTSIINFYIQKYDDCSFSIVTSPFARDIYTNMPRLSKVFVVNKKKYGFHWLDIIKFSFFEKLSYTSLRGFWKDLDELDLPEPSNVPSSEGRPS